MQRSLPHDLAFHRVASLAANPRAVMHHVDVDSGQETEMKRSTSCRGEGWGGEFERAARCVERRGDTG